MRSLLRPGTILGTDTTRNDERENSTNTTAQELRSSVYNHSPGPTLHLRNSLRLSHCVPKVRFAHPQFLTACSELYTALVDEVYLVL
jgi:hypothetical protein